MEEEWKIVDIVNVEDVAAVKRTGTTIVAEVVGIRGGIKILALLL
jgi:hypothetical protein